MQTKDVIIGVDPHKLSATIEVVDAGGRLLGGGRFATDRAGYAAMQRYVRQWPHRVWAVEGSGLRRGGGRGHGWPDVRVHRRAGRGWWSPVSGRTVERVRGRLAEGFAVGGGESAPVEESELYGEGADGGGVAVGGLERLVGTA
jgi:hypothetical protein